MIEIIKVLGPFVIEAIMIVAITVILWAAVKHRIPVSLRFKAKNVDVQINCGDANIQGNKEDSAT